MKHVSILAAAALVVAGAALAGCAATQDRADGTIAISVTEKGFVPAEVTVDRGKPVTLVVTRRTEHTCAKEFVMAAANIEEKLPLNQPVAITFTPNEPGEMRFACGMDMVAGKVVVR